MAGFWIVMLCMPMMMVCAALYLLVEFASAIVLSAAFPCYVASVVLGGAAAADVAAAAWKCFHDHAEVDWRKRLVRPAVLALLAFVAFVAAIVLSASVLMALIQSGAA